MKKTLAVILALAVLCIMAVGGTMSYLTYTDYDVNTMTVGNVLIRQDIKDRAGVTVTEKPLLPVTAVAETVTIGTANYELVPEEKNGVDKIVTVTNIGTHDAYIRTLVAFEAVEDSNGDFIDPIEAGMVTAVWADNSYIRLENVSNEPIIFTVDGVKYVLYYYTYSNEYGKDTETAPSLVQIYAASSVDNTFYDAVNKTYEVLVLSQAVQAAGFTDADEAFDAAFPFYDESSNLNVVDWFS